MTDQGPPPSFRAPRDAFRAAIQELAGAVCVLSGAIDGRIFAFPAVSVAEVPSSGSVGRLVVCADPSSPCWRSFTRAGVFAVNILSSDQREAADRLCDRRVAIQSERPAGLHWIVSGDGAPLLTDALVSFDCKSEEMIERKSCAIVFARVVALRRKTGSAALVRWRGALEQIGWSSEEIANAIGLSAPRPLSVPAPA
jgi:flavin reductase (DIM6/NTAB) family NADH-FMN oxidoreductase RutF